MITILLLSAIIILGLVAVARIIWVGALLALIPFFFIFIAATFWYPVWPIAIAIIFILVFNKNAKERKEYWM